MNYTFFMESFKNQHKFSDDLSNNFIFIRDYIKLGDDFLKAASFTKFQDHKYILIITLGFNEFYKPFWINTVKFEKNLFFNERLVNFVELNMAPILLLISSFAKSVSWHKT